MKQFLPNISLSRWLMQHFWQSKTEFEHCQEGVYHFLNNAFMFMCIMGQVS